MVLSWRRETRTLSDVYVNVKENSRLILQSSADAWIRPLQERAWLLTLLYVYVRGRYPALHPSRYPRSS
jgi:hypothetical protein